MDDVLKQLQNGSSHIYQDMLSIEEQLKNFKVKFALVDYDDIRSLLEVRTILSQVLIDVACLLTSILVMKRKITELVNGNDKFSLLPTKRTLLEELDNFHNNFRVVSFTLRETTHLLRDSYLRIVERDREE
jgi:hypothetical protein